MRFRYRGAIIGLVLTLPFKPCFAEVVDRIVAVIDREVVTLSEAALAQEIGVLRGGGEKQPLPVVVEHLIENRLIEREVRRYRGEAVPADQVSQAIDSIRESFSTVGAFREALATQGMTEESLSYLIRGQIAISRYLERRFRPLIHATEEEVRHYYEEELRPVLLKSGGVVPPYEEVAESILQIVEEKKFNQRVDEWIEALKSRTRIRRYVW